MNTITEYYRDRNRGGWAYPRDGQEGSMTNPTPEEIRTARAAAGLSQTAAAALIYSTLRTWQDWEAGVAKMHPGLFELFTSKTRCLSFPDVLPMVTTLLHPAEVKLLRDGDEILMTATRMMQIVNAVLASSK